MTKEYNISKTNGQCLQCHRTLSPGETFVAVVREQGEDLLREDYCPACWQARQADATPPPAELVGVWHAKVPLPQEKKRQFVDNETLIQFFTRLADAQDETRLAFRFVLSLVLMRKRILVYDGMTRDESGRETWSLHFRGSEEVHRVLDPKMDEDKIGEVSRRLDEILPSGDDSAAQEKPS